MKKFLVLVIVLIIGFVSCGCISSQQPIIATNSSTNTSTTTLTTTPVVIQSNPVTASQTISPELVSYQKGLELYNQKKYLEAIDAFNTTISLNKTNGEAYFARGKAFYQIGRIKFYEFRGEEEFNQAISDFGLALNNGLNSHDSRELFTLRGYSNYWIGYIYQLKYYLTGKNSFSYFETAATDFSRLLDNNPDDIDALIGRSIVYDIVGVGTSELKYPYDQNKAELSGKDAQQAVELAPHNAWAHYALAIHLGDIEKLSQKEVIKQYDEAIKDDPEEAWFYLSRGFARFKILDSDGARSDYLKAIDLQPRLANAYHNLAQVDAQEGKAEDALVNYQKGLEINPNIAMWWYDFAAGQWNLMSPITISGSEEVLKSIDRAIAIDPEHPTYHYQRWQILIYLNRIPEAKEEVRIFKHLETSDREFGTWMEDVTANPYYYGNYIERH